jgi:hypothetical protein
LTNGDVSTPDRVAAVEHWYRHRTSIENIFRDSKHGAALRHLPSGYREVNIAWMWGALLAASMAGWLHQLTATEGLHGRLSGWGVRAGKAMIETLRHRLIRVPAGWFPMPDKRSCVCHPARISSPRSWPGCARYPQRTDRPAYRPIGPDPVTLEPANPTRYPGWWHAPATATTDRRSTKLG